ncbi:conserved hypothetical protein [Rhizobium mesoamericanum STM3625]|uniref:Virulence-associated protein E-like domain-containing protein n=1 Tax=Rhizobium mesoamericanum STM3625 TaxID=1211777 RepID=K0PND8_9HYPH|nr:conserved hypothetical protein [Rhizobium mesoamericanum STM3625]
MRTGAIDIEALKRDRDQLFAEAYARYQRGEHWWPDAEFEARVVKPEQETRFEADMWEPLVADYLDGKDRATTADIAAEALGLFGGNVNPAHGRRISAVMRVLGWEHRKTEGKRYWRKAA